MTTPTLAQRVQQLDWAKLGADLVANGWAVTPQVLDDAEVSALVQSYDRPELFRSRVVMQRHAYGQGEYQYFQRPLPAPVDELRHAFFPHLSVIANDWAEKLGEAAGFPDDLDAYLARCHDAGQLRPTPLLLKYGPGDYNRLHQDLYGPLNFPLQAVFLLSRPGVDFEGGELVLTETRARMQTRPMVVPLGFGQAAIMAVNNRPVASPRGYSRAGLRHGVSEVRSGRRHTMGLIFHDAT